MSKKITGRVSKDPSVKVNSCPRCHELTVFYRKKYDEDEAPIEKKCANPECTGWIRVGV